MNKNIKIFLLLVFTCVACFLIHDNVHAATSLDDLTNPDSSFENHPYQQFVNDSVVYCHDHGTQFCKTYFKPDSADKINYNFFDFYEKLIDDYSLKYHFYLKRTTGILSDNPRTIDYILFSKEPMLLKKEKYVSSNPNSKEYGNIFSFTYEKVGDKLYYSLARIGDNIFSFDVYTKDTYNLEFLDLYDKDTNMPNSSTSLVYSNTVLKDVSGNVIFDESDVKFDIEAPQKSIFDIIKQTFKEIVQLPYKIVKALIEGIIELVNGLFVPEKNFFSNWFNDMKSLFEQKLGFLSYPFTFILDLLNRFLSLEDTKSYVIIWPEIKVPIYDVSIINSGSFSLNELLNNAAFNTLYDLYILVTDALMIIAFINLCKKTYDKAFGGGV